MLMTLLLLCAAPLQGPMLGDLTPTSVRIWFRQAEAGPATVQLLRDDGGPERQLQCMARPDADLTVTAHLTGLAPDTVYHYRIDGTAHADWRFKTPPEHDTHARLAFGSCAKEAEGSGRVWRRIKTLNPDGVVLLGDTPYIDTTDLAVQRRRYREFVSFPAFAHLARHVPVYATWDDHDFGLNDTDGRLAGKDNSRQAFSEYRPNPSHGAYGEGIYTTFRAGPMQVWLLDTRWFARTEGEAPHWSLLGRAQWQWLERTIKQSEAPFKVIACGMVFNGSVRPGKHDCWGAYASEYTRLRDLIDGVQGVVLVSGDVHWSREMAHDGTAAWPLCEFITSPVHEHLIAAADPPHPMLRWSRGEVNSFLVLDARGETMRCSFMNADGEVLHHRTLTLPPQ